MTNTNWADGLLNDYAGSRKQLNKARHGLNRNNPESEKDLTCINSMLSDLDYATEWLRTGKQPDALRGINSKGRYQKQYLESIECIPDITEQLGVDINEKSLYMTQEEKGILISILSSFSARERQCYLMHVAERRSMSEIADVLDLKKRSVQQYIERARKKVEQEKNKVILK